MTAPNGGGSNHPHPWPAELAAEETVVYPAGTTLFRERDRVKSVQIIVSGVVRTSVMRGGGELFLGVCGPGWPLSAVPALLEGIQITTAVAVTETEVTRCSLDRFQRHRRDVPEVADWLQRMFAKEASADGWWPVRAVPILASAVASLIGAYAIVSPSDWMTVEARTCTTIPYNDGAASFSYDIDFGGVGTSQQQTDFASYAWAGAGRWNYEFAMRQSNVQITH